MKTTAIVCVFSNPQYARTTPRGLELIYLKDLLESKGRRVLIFGKKCRTNKDLDFFYDISEIEDHTIDSIILQLAPANFFGGKYDEWQLTAIEKMAKFQFEYKKVLFNILPTDPRIKPLNPAQVFFDRFGLMEDHIPAWENILKHGTYLFPGKDLNKFFGTKNLYHTFHFDWFAYIFKKGVEFSNFVSDDQKEYDVIYYGDNRGTHRKNRVKHLMPYSTKNLLLGFKEPKITYAEFKKKVNHSELFEILNKCRVSIVVADEEHEDNVVTFRFYEALASSALAAIDIRFDPNKELIKDPKLREILYVENMNDVKKLANMYSENLIYLQQQELKRIFDEHKI